MSPNPVWTLETSHNMGDLNALSKEQLKYEVSEIVYCIYVLLFSKY